MCFASDDRKSLNDLAKWKKKVEEECPNIPMIIAQTKMDLMNDNTKDIIPKYIRPVRFTQLTVICSQGRCGGKGEGAGADAVPHLCLG